MATKTKIIILIPILIALLMPSAFSLPISPEIRDYVESRIRSESIYRDNDTYFIDYTEDGNEYRASPGEYFGVRIVNNIGMYVIEIDPHVSQRITFLDNYTLRVQIDNNPNNPYPESRIPLRLCMSNNSVMNANRFETDLSYCDHDKEYYVGNIRIGSEYAIRLNENIHGTTSLIWWLGEDDLDGTYGQGGGLPTCDYKYADISLNQTQTIVNQTFQMGMKYEVQGIGCGSVSTLEEQNYQDTSIWRLIPTFNSAVTNLQCLSSTCSKSSPVVSTWYYRTVRCDEVGNRSIRVAIFSSFDTNYNSPTRNMECLPIPTTEEAINRPYLPIKEDDDYLFFLPFAFIIMSSFLLLKARKEEKP